MRRSKFNAVRTKLDGITFASRKEANRYQELKLLEKAGEISKLALQPSFILSVNGQKICKYVADFGYIDIMAGDRGELVIEDVKGVKTPAYRLKKKLMSAIYGIEIKEV